MIALPALALLVLGVGAWQDMRTRRVSNLITVPAFFAAWPVAVMTGGGERVLLVLAVFVATLLAVPHLGPADGKLAVFTGAVFGEAALAAWLALAGGAFALLRLQGRPQTALPGVPFLFAGAALTYLLRVFIINHGL